MTPKNKKTAITRRVKNSVKLNKSERAKAILRKSRVPDGVLTPKQRVTIEALRKYKGLVTLACEASNISRTTYYSWLKEDDFKKEVDSVEDFVLDQVEDVAHALIESGNTAMTMFYLRTRAKKRGYVEKQEIEHSTGDLSSFKSILEDMITKYEVDY